MTNQDLQPHIVLHDLSNQMAGAWGRLYLARVKAAGNEAVLHSLSLMDRHLAEATSLIQKLRAVLSGKDKQQQGTCNVREPIRLAASLTELCPGIACHVEIPEVLPYVDMDQVDAGSIVNNLIMNAIQALPQAGAISIVAENAFNAGANKGPLDDGQYVKLQVRDNGVGIPEHQLSRIFEPGFSTKGNGNGLGLAGVKQIVEEHGGHIEVESEPGVGTTFTVWLRAKVEEMVAIAEG